MEKKQITKILNEISVLYELNGEDFFKIRAYQMAARALEVSELEISKDTRLEDLKKIRGIGESIASQIKSLIDTGTLKIYDDLRNSVPQGLVEMLKIPKLGPKKIKYLFDNLNIKNIVELEKACLANRLVSLPNFGLKTQENILHGIRLLKKYKERFLYSDVIDKALIIEERLKSYRYIARCSIAGSLRRKNETVKDIDIVASVKDLNDSKKVMDFFTNLESVEEIIAKGDTKSSIRLKDGMNSDLRLVTDEKFPFALHHFTGSREHNTALRSLARKTNIKMNEYGLFKIIEPESNSRSTGNNNDAGDVDNGSAVDREEEITDFNFKSENDIYSYFNMSYIEPEMRENTGEIEAALDKKLPDLIKENDLKGLFHFHTTNSDGNMSLEQAIQKLKGMGFEYCGIADHSKTARYAGGIPDENIDKYLSEIEAVNKKYPDFKVFKGIESDIHPDGNLDYSNEVLEKFDFVIIAIHSNFNMDRKQMTERIIKAMQNSHTTLLSHPTGRLLLARDPYEVDIMAIIDAAAEYNVDIEINASPFRLDLDWLNCKYAKEKKVKLFINPDAHSLDGFNDYRYGINVARKGWLRKNDVANTMTKHEMEEYLASKRQKKY